ncbi:MAG: 30S ribosomal protein S12 methylthiotransferase RimO [Pseudomonadota bacterium]
MPGPEGKIKVGLISLGCPKNLVDSEVMLGLLKKDGFELTNDEAQADVMIVNTCAFIDPSKKESVQTVLDVARRKSKGRLKKLIVTGCLPQRYKGDLEKELPEVDHFLGTGEFHRIAEFARMGGPLPLVRSVVKRPQFLYDYATPRISTLPKHTVYVKVGEGCSRACSFCVIPRLRGRVRSRTIESVAREVERYARSGVLEINLLAQDLTAYGHDLNDGTDLEGLLKRLVDVKGVRWIRLLYTYPMHFTRGLVRLIASSPQILKYLDIPLQHIDGDLLASMQRRVDEKETRDLLTELRSSIPNLTLRTTLIVGFPGESKAQFEKLVRFVEETEFDRLGVFTYSREEGTKAALLPNQVPERVKNLRRDRIMGIAQKISLKKNLAHVGEEMDVLVDRTADHADGYTHVGRTEGQALDIDGTVFLKGKGVAAGRLVRARITGAAEYDLFAEAI